MALSFNFRKESSKTFGYIYRPWAKVLIWSERYESWETIWMIVDTGADYTLLPFYLAEQFGIGVNKLKSLETRGIGGSGKVYLYKKLKVRLGNWERLIPAGFLENSNVPPLMGRQMFIETFETHFSRKHVISFDEK